jgi:hypothetical protein
LVRILALAANPGLFIEPTRDTRLALAAVTVGLADTISCQNTPWIIHNFGVAVKLAPNLVVEESVGVEVFFKF